jgi:hypothetical protein
LLYRSDGGTAAAVKGRLPKLLLGLLVAGAGACGGSGPPYTPVSATTDTTGTLYTLQLGGLKMVIDASTGARITEFSLNGTNVLTGPDVDPANYGGTFWPSPQSSWCQGGVGCWPPIAALDTRAYTGSIDAATNVIQLTSAPAVVNQFPASAVTVTKQFTPVPASGEVYVTYTLTNVSPSVDVTLAPWQVSRVQATGGLTFFASPDGAVTYTAGSDPAFMLTADAAGDLWYQFAPVATGSKALADSSGWLAHVTAGGLLFLLAYPDIQPTDAAPGEAEAELYTGPSADYLEMETQGAYTDIAPGGTLVWSVRWKLRQVPSGTSVAVGSADLLSFASTTLAE